MARRNNFEEADEVMPVLNTGSMFDIMSGKFLPGEHGDMILNGGLSYLTGIVGPGNSFKTALMWYFMLAVMDAYRETEGVSYDTEISQKRERPIELSWSFDRIMTEILPDVVRSGMMSMTNAKKYLGDQWYSMFCDVMDAKYKDVKNNEFTTPFIDRDGVKVKAIRPDVYAMDSLSNFVADAVAKKQDEHDIGHSKRNMESMTSGRIKSQMLMELPVKTARGGGYCIMTAHVGEAFQLDPHSPPAKKLAFMNQKFKLKDTPEKFTFLMNNCWYLTSATPLWNGSTQAERIPKYPRNSDDKMAGDTDLMVVLCSNLRGKGGGSGMPFDVIMSQSEGFLNSLSEFEYLRAFNRYGIAGNLQNYYLDLRPEAKLSRTVVRAKFDDDYKLRRALHISYEMCYMRNNWHDEALQYHIEITPEMLYNKLAADGYDWDELLETDPRYNFLELIRPGDRPRLTTMDLLNMYLGTYFPYWMDPATKRAKGAPEPVVKGKKGKAPVVQPLHPHISVLPILQEVDSSKLAKALKEPEPA